MPSDQDEKRAEWPDAGAMQAMQWAVPADEVAQSAGDEDVQSGQEPIDTDDLLMLDTGTDTENDLLNWTRQPLVSKESLTNFGRQFSPVLVPLPFALIVFCLTLPVTLRGLSPLSPLVTGILLLVLAVFQGVLLSSAGTNDTLWMLYIALGYALFIVSGVFAILGVGAALVTLAALLLLGILLAQRGIHPTKEGHVDLVETFGKYTHTLYPGLNLLLPWEKVSQRLNTQETIWTSPLQRVPTSRERDVQLTATISYQLLPEDAHLAALTIQDWETALQRMFVGTIQSVVNELAPGDFISWTQSIYARAAGEANSFNPAAATRWERICTALCRRMQDQVATWGVQVNWIHIQDLTLLPHDSGSPGHEGGSTQVMDPEQNAAQTPLPGGTPPVPRPETTPESVPSPKLPGKGVTVEMLVDFYNSVRQGAITSPAMILEIAQGFEHLARDPVQNRTFPFDAERAASTLRARAQKLQELAQVRATASASASNDSPAKGE